MTPTASESHERWEGTVPDALAGERLDRVLAALVPDLSRSQAQRLLRQGRCSVDGIALKPSDSVVAGARIILSITAPEANVQPEQIPLAILYEDDELLAVNKPPGMAVHPARGTPSGTLLNAICGYLGEGCRPTLVHRIDRDTSGAILAAKTVVAHRRLKEQMDGGGLKRAYWALVWGQPKPRRGRIEAPIERVRGDKTRMEVRDGGKLAATRYRVIGSGNWEGEAISLVEAMLETGRTHQVRVHFEWIGCPLLGEQVYRGKRGQATPGEAQLTGQALHSRRLGFTHPATGEAMSIEADPPAEFAAILDALSLG